MTAMSDFRELERVVGQFRFMRNNSIDSVTARRMVNAILPMYAEGVTAGTIPVYSPTVANAMEQATLWVAEQTGYQFQDVWDVLLVTHSLASTGAIQRYWIDPERTIKMTDDQSAEWGLTDLLPDWIKPVGAGPDPAKYLSKEITKIALIGGGALVAYLLLRDMIVRRPTR